jgi:hypothetical protein
MSDGVYAGKVVWHSERDPEVPGYTIHSGQPAGMPEHSIIVQDVGNGLWGWLLMYRETPVQMRNGYRSVELAKTGVQMWLEVNSHG